MAKKTEEPVKLMVKATKVGVYGAHRRYPPGSHGRSERAQQPFELAKPQHFSHVWMEAIGWDPVTTKGVRPESDSIGPMAIKPREDPKNNPKTPLHGPAGDRARAEARAMKEAEAAKAKKKGGRASDKGVQKK